VTAAVTVSDLQKRYTGSTAAAAAVDGVSLRIEEGEFYSLLGPSGCGKTTTMRCIGGLERIDRGSISIFGTVVSSDVPHVFIPPNERGIGMVFQSYAIWPHMTVFENAAFPLRVGRERISRAELNNRVEEALAVAQISAYAGRMATQLSGGQQQRLALARAIVARPKVLLLDEPLSNLDARLRDQMRAELRSIQLRLGVTTIYVTHDQVEALSMSSRLAVMIDGHIVQEGRPAEVYAHPKTAFIAGFLGNSNIFEATLIGNDGDIFVAESPAGRIRIVCPAGVRAGERVTVIFRPESVVLHLTPVEHALPATVDTFTFLGELAETQVRIGETTLRARHAPSAMFAPGDAVHVELAPHCFSVVTNDSGARAEHLV
jgi:iron(III) transport system ATP-binding protein